MKSLEKICGVNLHCGAEYFIIRRSQSLSLSKFRKIAGSPAIFYFKLLIKRTLKWHLNLTLKFVKRKVRVRAAACVTTVKSLQSFYGGSEAPVSIILNHDELNNAQAHDSFYSDVITLVVEGKEVAVKVQAMQRHPFKPKLVHIDFKRA